MAYVTLSAKTHIVHTSMYIEKKQNLKKLFVKLHMLLENIYKEWWGQQSAMEASNQQKLYTILLAWLLESLKFLLRFRSLNGECVTYICLQCNRYKQNHYHFLDKIATIDKCAVCLRVISIAYLFGQHFELNPSTVDKCKLKLWLQM